MISSDRLSRLFALVLLATPTVALAQLDDPGLEAPPPPKGSTTTTAAPPPAAKPTTTTTTTTTTTSPPPSAIPPPSAVPPSGEPAIKEDVKEEVSDSPAATLTDDEWEQRMVAPTLMGTVGLLRTMTAEQPQPLNFRVASHIQLFQANSFLVSGSGSVAGDQESRFLGDLTIGLSGPDVTFLRNLELYLAILNSSSQNVRTDTGRTDPTVILGLGDTAVGLKGAGYLGKGLSIGGNVGVRFFNSISGIIANFDATNVAVDAIGSFDARKLAPAVPLRIHLNVGYLVDNSLNLLPAGQCAQSTGNDSCIRSRVVETFAYGLGSSRLRTALAVDVPLRPHAPWGIFGIEPFVEYHLEYVAGQGDLTVEKALKNTSGVTSDRIENQLVQYITGGVRLRPVARLVLDVGVDVGLQSPGFRYGPALATWNLIFGAAYTYDPMGGGTRLVKRTVTRTVEVNRAPPEGKIRGIVKDAKTKKPIAGAIVVYKNSRLTPQATGEDGVFQSYGLPGGSVTVEVSHGDDYEPSTVATNVDLNTETPLEVTLKQKPPKESKVRLKVSDDKGAPVVGGSAHFTGAIGMRDALPEGDGFLAQLPAGDYTAAVDAPGYLAKEKQVTVVAGADQVVELVIHKRPAVSHVQVTKDQIVLKGTIHFGTNNAIILPDGQQLLDEVVDVLAKNQGIRKVSVEGHTDNRGIADKNLKLSQDRAAAVVTYLVSQGIDANRLSSQGFGATKPLVPNLTPANRAKNRRVEFKIVDQGAGGFPQ